MSSAPGAPTVLLITSEESGWQTVRQAVAEAVGSSAVTEARDRSEALRVAVERQPALVFVPGVLGAEATSLVASLRQVLPEAGIVAVGPRYSATEVLRLLEVGATGCLTWHDLTVKALPHVIGLALSGRFLLGSPSVCEALRGHWSPTRPAVADTPLTARELLVLYDLAHGLTQSEIAATHNCSLRTVRRLVSAAERKLSVHNKFMLGLRVGQLGIVA